MLNGDDETVEAFALHWLGIKGLTMYALDAVKSALLDDSWLGRAAGSVAEFIHSLYEEVYHPGIVRSGKGGSGDRGLVP
ncbi:hypothetical protein ACQGFI_00025 [Rhodococcus sp. 2.95]